MDRNLSTRSHAGQAGGMFPCFKHGQINKTIGTFMNIWRLLAGICCGLTIGAFATEPAPIMISETITPPTLDGSLDDPAWKNAAKIETLYGENVNIPVKNTTVYLVRDDKWLYVGFKCVNSNMIHVIQTAFKHDDYLTISRNDTVEVCIQPGETQDRWYWFLLSFANVRCEQRVTGESGANIGWNAPWRSVTKRLPDGWTAEVAIPLYALECDDLSGAKINVIRDYVAITLDYMGARQSEETLFYGLNPGNRPSFHKPGNFVAVAGLGGFKAEVPFAPRLQSASVTGLREQDGQYFYDVKVTLMRFTPVAGKALVQVVETMDDKDVEKASELVDLNVSRRDLVLNVPAGDVREYEYKIRVAVVDPLGGSVLASTAIEDTSALNLFKKAFVGRSYYTTEPTAKIRLEFGIPETMAREITLILEVNGAIISETRGVSTVMTPEIPVDAFSIGHNPLIVRLISAGKELARRTLSVQRLEPRPGFEVKTDFIKGILLKDDRPIFPVGIYVPLWSDHTWSNPESAAGGCEEDLFRYLKDVGFNTLVNAHPMNTNTHCRSATTNTDIFARLADKYGMNVVEWVSPHPRTRDKTLPLNERLAIFKEWYEKMGPVLIDNSKILREHRNMLAYYNVDEPNLGDQDVKIALAEWYWNTVNAIDPYRPRFLLYSQMIPHGDNWTRWGEMLGYDIYPGPFMPRIQGNPGLYTAAFAYNLRERCRLDNKVMFFVPLANMLDLRRTPVGMSKAHILCQAYTAVIYGARGLLYFSLQCVKNEDAWDGLREVCAQFREMTPALVNGDIARNIRYTPDDFRPRERIFPMVNAAVFQYPDGDYLLLAVNIMPYAVDTKFTIGGLQRVARMFAAEGQRGKGTEGQRDKWAEAQRILGLDEEAFTDKIEGYGTRAYRLQLNPRPAEAAEVRIAAPVKVAVDMTALNAEKAPSVDIPKIRQQVLHGKNHVLNPAFKLQVNKGVPDFYMPNCAYWLQSFYAPFNPDGGKPGSFWYLDEANPWNGMPSLRMEYTTSWGFDSMSGLCWPPDVTSEPCKRVFSFYAKGAKAGDSVIVSYDYLIKGGSRSGNRFALTTEWKRYQVAGDAPALREYTAAYGPMRQFKFAPGPNSIVWVNGLQLEEGETATAFHDDSVQSQ